MKLLDIVKTVGSSAVKELVPGGGVLINAVNEFLPKEHRLPNTATGDDVENALNTLPAEQRAKVMEKEFDVKITDIEQRGKTVRAMLEADAMAKHTTRPYVIKHSFHLVAVVTLAITTAWFIGVVKSDEALVEAVMSGYPFILTLTAPFVWMLKAYFGILRDEDRTRRDAANGLPTSGGVRGFMSQVMTKKQG